MSIMNLSNNHLSIWLRWISRYKLEKFNELGSPYDKVGFPKGA